VTRHAARTGGTPALRLLTETLRADANGVTTGTQFRQILLDGEAALRLRREIGNDCYDVLEVLFILAEAQPGGGVVIHGGAQRLSEHLQWSRQKASRVVTELEALGYVQRSQEAVLDPNGSRRFGKGVIVLNTAAAVDPQRLDPERPADLDLDHGLWGKPLSPAVCSQTLGSWGVRDAERLVERTDGRLLSDAVKFVAYELRTGASIDNPGAYVRAVVTNRRVAAPGPHVDPTYLDGDLELVDLIGASPAARENTVERARASADARHRQLDTIANTMDPDERTRMGAELADLMRAFTFEPDDIQTIRFYDLLENALAERGLLAGLPPAQSSTPPPAWAVEDG